MNFNADNSLSEEFNKSFDSSNFNDSFIQKEEKNSFIQEEKPQKKRRISKLSLKLEELKNKTNQIEENDIDISTDDFEIDLDETRQSSITSENKSNENIYSKFEIYFSFLFNNKEFLVSIESDVFNLNENNVQDLIKNIIYKINEKNIIFQHKKVKYIISLKDCEDPDFYKDNYELRNYETKDFSKYPFDLPLSDIKDTKLYFVSKNCLNLMIRKY
jgi:hypothetical protein